MYLGNKGLNPGIFHIPPELGHAPTGPTHRVGILGKVAQVVLVVCGLVQPRRGPKELVLQSIK